MAKVKLTVDQLSRLHDKVTVKGSQKIGGGKDVMVKDYAIEVKEDYLEVKAVSHTDLSAVHIRWADVESIEETGDIVIWSAEKFGQIPKRFNSDDTLIIEDTGKSLKIKREEPAKQLKMKSTNKQTLDCLDEGFIDSTEYDEEADHYETQSGKKLNTVVKIDSKYLKDVVEDAEFIEADSLPLKVKDGHFVVDAGNDEYGRVQQTLPAESVRGEAEAKYHYGIGGITKNNSGTLKLFFSDDNPLVIEKNADDYQAKYIVTPQVA